MKNAYARLTVLSLIITFMTIGHGVITGSNEPNWTLYLHYGVLMLFTYSQWSLAVDVDNELIIPVMLAYSCFVAYLSQAVVSYLDVKTVVVMTALIVFSGYGFYMAKSAAVVSSDKTLESRKRVVSYILRTSMSSTTTLLLGTIYWFYVGDVGFIIPTLWLVVYAIMVSINHIKVYDNQKKNLVVKIKSFAVNIARTLMCFTSIAFLFALVAILALSARALSLFEVISVTIGIIALLIASAFAFWSSDTE